MLKVRKVMYFTTKRVIFQLCKRRELQVWLCLERT